MSTQRPTTRPEAVGPRIGRTLVLLSLSLTALIGLGCAGDDDDGAGSPAGGGGAAKVGGSLTVYSGRAESLVQSIIDDFEKTTGVDVKVKYGDTAELASLIFEEGKKSPADVYIAQDAGALGAVAKGAFFEPLAAATTRLVPAEYRAPDSLWVGLSGRARVIVYNPGLVTAAELPASVRDLTAAKWKGKVGWAPTNGSFQAFVTGMRQID
ncbi:MAG: extracellular solute-binding protein, partial [Tepidiformaceae bacterium]